MQLARLASKRISAPIHTRMAASTFRTQIVSDLHLDLCDYKPVIARLRPQCDNIALCGDIGAPGRDHYRDVLKHCSERWRDVFVVLGNHEFYSRRSMEDIVGVARDDCGRFPNVHLLYRDLVSFNGYDVYGGTLWSNIPREAYNDVASGINDYRMIWKRSEYLLGTPVPGVFGSGGPRLERVTIDDTNLLHEAECVSLERVLETTHQPVIVFTHHAPLITGVADPKYEKPDRRLNYAFCTDLSRFMQPRVKLWGFGHTHFSCDFTRNETRVITNAAGYEFGGEVTGWNPDRVYEVDLKV